MKEELWKQIEDEAEEYGPFKIKMIELETLRDILYPPNIRTVNTRHEESVCPECEGAGQYFQKNPDCLHCGEYKTSCEGMETDNTCTVPTLCQTCHGTGRVTNEK